MYIYVHVCAFAYMCAIVYIYMRVYVYGNLRFILSVRSDFHMTDRLSIAVHSFVSRMSMSFSVDETLLPR